VPHDSQLMSGIYAALRDRLLVIVGSADVDLFDTGLVDSVGLVELILELEDRFGISLPMDNLEIDDLRTVRRIADLILRVSDESIGRVALGR
jgi:D-alanine--poly(phosphoribitol) ligase subunit 2